MTALPLVDCEPYGTRLLEKRCVRRYELANGNPKGRTGHAREVQRARQNFRLCTECEVGKARAGGDQVGEVHETEARGAPPPVEPPPAVEPPNPPAPAPAPSAGPPASKERDVKTKTCKVVDCPNQFEVAKGNRKHCDEHQDPKDRAGLEVEGKAKRRAAHDLNKAIGDSNETPAATNRKPTQRKRTAKAATSAPAAGVVSAKELLELAGFEVREVPTPAGTLLFVEEAA
ncbi:MAG: hypothetical protein JJ863_21555 [Deltaproteobacteria bacterium]|nr:hypothetical protein [Deltaproteobacteria bacterium]